MEDTKQGNNSSKKSNEEEIDLGQLFSLIGKVIFSTIDLIGNIFLSIFYWGVSVLLFLKKHVIKLTIGTILGAVGGNLYQSNFKVPIFESSMTVQPNFGSAIQLYKNIDYYQNLVSQRDIERLAISLNVTTEEASKITSFKAKPYSTPNQTLLSYRRFTASLDSTTLKHLEFDEFSENQPIESFMFHIVSVTSKDKYVFGKLRSPIISSIIRNPYYDQVRKTSSLNLSSSKIAIQNSMQELDTLRDFYKDIMVSESKKSTSGTNIYMSSTNGNDKEIVVFDKYMKMNKLLIDVNKKLTEENDIINVVSSFNPVGKRVIGWRRNYTLLGGVFGFILVFSLFLIQILNKKLKEYEEKIKAFNS